MKITFDVDHSYYELTIPSSDPCEIVLEKYAKRVNWHGEEIKLPKPLLACIMRRQANLDSIVSFEGIDNITTVKPEVC